MKLLSWNVNGLRACVKKGFWEFLREENPDAICLQETKMEQAQADFSAEGYTEIWNSAQKKGYSGTAIFTKREPQSVALGMDMPQHDLEGRLITADYGSFYLVNCYTPNSQHELARLPYRLEWEDDLRAYLIRLDLQKPVVFCGDLNVAHTALDLKNAKQNRGNPGFTDQERVKLSRLLNCGFTDTFRHFHPTETDAFSWWSYRGNVRERNIGWRIDYFLVSDRLLAQVHNPRILPHVMGSDHCPVGLELSL